jgi:hypothetical protein
VTYELAMLEKTLIIILWTTLYDGSRQQPAWKPDITLKLMLSILMLGKRMLISNMRWSSINEGRSIKRIRSNSCCNPLLNQIRTRAELEIPLQHSEVRTAIWKKKSRNGFWAWSFYDLVRTSQAVSALQFTGRHLLPENMNCFHCHRPHYNQTDCLHKSRLLIF